MKKRLVLGLFLLMAISCALSFVGCAPQELSCPINVKIKQRILTWDAVEGATGYAIEIKEFNDAQEKQEYTTTETSFAVVDVVAGRYDIGVKALGDGKKYADSSYMNINFKVQEGVESGKDEIGFFYKMMEDGTGYEVYRSASPKGVYGEKDSNVNYAHLLGDVKIPDFFDNYPVKRIADFAFSYLDTSGSYDPVLRQKCNVVTTGVELPKYLESIGKVAFKGCVELQKPIYVPDGVVIENAAFVDCIKLTEVRLPADLEELQGRTFTNVPLNSIELPQTLKKIGANCFECETWRPSDGDYVHVNSQLSSVTIPASVKEIGASAFEGREKLRNITILSKDLELFGYGVFKDTAWWDAQPEGLVYLGENREILYGYKGALSFDTLTVPDHAVCLVGGCLSGINARKIVLHDKVKLVGPSVFSMSSVEEFDWPKHLSDVPEYTFSGCTNLKDLSFFLDVFEGEEFGNTFAYNTVVEEVTIPSSIKVLDGSFSGCKALKTVNFSNGLETIKDSTFSNCTSLEEVYFPDTLKVMEGGVFRRSGLRIVVLPTSLEEMSPVNFNITNNLRWILYKGTKEQFKDITNSAKVLSEYYEFVYYYSESQPTEEGNYWRYVDGKATPWESVVVGDTRMTQPTTDTINCTQLPAIIKEEN